MKENYVTENDINKEINQEWGEKKTILHISFYRKHYFLTKHVLYLRNTWYILTHLPFLFTLKILILFWRFK